jgi:organic radical activating enzyme
MRCEGCQNADLQPFEGGTTINLTDLPKILEKRDLPTWICWLGGDAVYQPDGFLAFNQYFKSKKYKICLYTGKLKDEVTDLLENVDLVVDGAWEGKTIKDNDTNQIIYFRKNNKWENYTYLELKELLMNVD